MNRKHQPGRISVAVLLISITMGALAQDNNDEDPFGGRLFPPNLVLERQNELALSDSQRREIRELVISTQTAVAEHQWDMREAYQNVVAEFDEPMIDEAAATDLLQVVLETENRMKLTQVSMLIRLRNLLTAEQISILRSAAQ